MESRAEWVKEFPWLTRLREVSPVSEAIDFLWPRWREESEEWWLYRAVPLAIMDPSRILQYQTHWSELPTSEQFGRRRFVTEYQFWMFHTHRLDVTPFWILQGSRTVIGGTPYSFTERERRMLEAEGLEGAEPIPPGTLPQVPFDERAVAAIRQRDRLIKAEGDLERLKRENRAETLRAEDALAEQDYRKTFLKYHRERMAPQAAFMDWFTKQKVSQMALPAAPEGLASRLAHWEDDFVQTGDLGGGTATSRKIQIAVR